MSGVENLTLVLAALVVVLAVYHHFAHAADMRLLRVQMNRVADDCQRLMHIVQDQKYPIVYKKVITETRETENG